MKIPVGRFPVELPFAFGGLSDDVALDKQPPATTSEAFNVRGLDCVTGRTRGGKRPGRSKQCGTAISGYPVRELVSVVFTQKTVDYAEDPGVVWEQTTPANTDCLWGEADGEGNVYILNGDATVTKLSPAGSEIETFSLPAKAGSVCRALDVDEGANVYVGVSGSRGEPQGVAGSGEPDNGMLLGNIETARLWKLRHAFRNNDDTVEPSLEVAWTLTRDSEDEGPTLYGLVTFVRVKGGRLYTLQANNETWKNWLVIYDQIHAGIPVETFVQEVPYPASSIDVSAKGLIAITVENFSRRGDNPEHPECTASIVGWDPALNIDDDLAAGKKKHRPWIHLKVEAQYLRTSGGEIPGNGDEVREWYDASGSGRFVRFAVEDDKKPPVYRESGLGGKPSILCDGATHLMVSSTSPTSNADFRDAQQGIFPAYKDPADANRSAQFAVFALMRPEAVSTAALSSQFPLWDQATTYSTLSDHQALIINRKASDTLADINNTEGGAVSWFLRADATDGGEGTSTGLMPAYIAGEDAFDNKASALLVTAFACNGVGAADPAVMRSLLRVWGRPVDRFTQEADTLATTVAQYLMGYDSADYSTMTLCKGEWSEILVLDRRDLDVVAADAVCSHPFEPDSATGNMVGQVVIDAEGTGGGNATDQPLAFSGGGPTNPATGTWTSNNGRITSVKITFPGRGYTSRPTVTATGYTGAGASLLAGMSYRNGTKGAAVITIAEKIEAYLAWKYGVAHLLHVSSSDNSPVNTYEVKRVNGSGTAGVYHWDAPHPYANPHVVTPFIDVQGPPESDITEEIFRYAHKGEMLILMDSTGKLMDVDSHVRSGIGLGCRFNADGTDLYTVGNTAATNGTTGLPISIASVRRFAVTEAGNLQSAWLAETALRMSGPTCGLKVDAAGNVYVPCNAPLDTANAFTFAVFSNVGAIVHEYSLGATTANQGAYCIVLPREIVKADLETKSPDTEGDVAPETVEFLYVLGKKTTYAGTSIEKAVRRYRLITATPNGDPPRLRADLAVSNGGIYRYDSGLPVAVTGGATALQATVGASEYVHAAVIGQKAYFSDGASYAVYDPKTDEVGRWEPSHGTLPERCPIIEHWRGRAVLLGDGTGAVRMSKVLDADNWEFSPPTPTPAQACEFASTQVGNVPDRVTGFAPLSDDVALVGAAGSTWLLRGDPMFGGQLDRLSDTVGMAFGRAWCKDGYGRLWFLTDRGSLYTFGGSGLEHFSRNKIERRLAAIDLSTHYVRMAYDQAADGIWIFPIPKATPSVVVTTFFVEIRTGAMWEDYINNASSTVTAVLAVDGDDPEDRQVLTGHADAFVRKVDPEATSDDGVAIQASVLLGPFKGPIEGYEIRTLKLGCTLAYEQDGLSYSLYVSDRADGKGAPVRQGTFGSGANMRVSARGTGSYVFVELTQTSASSRFALERLWLDAELAGVQRVRG